MPRGQSLAGTKIKNKIMLQMVQLLEGLAGVDLKILSKDNLSKLVFVVYSVGQSNRCTSTYELVGRANALTSNLTWRSHAHAACKKREFVLASYFAPAGNNGKEGGRGEASQHADDD